MFFVGFRALKKHVYYCFLILQLLYVCYAYLVLNYKIIENIDFCSWRTSEKINKNVFNFIFAFTVSNRCL